MKNYRKFSIFLSLVLLVTSLNFNPINIMASETDLNTVGEGTDESSENTAPAALPVIDSMGLNSQTAVLIDATSGIVIYDKNKDQRMYPASITKIMTTLLALEEVEDFSSRRVKFSHEAVFSIPVGSSHIAMNEDETLSYNDALLGIMLESANDVSNAVAEDLGETVAGFGEMMTARARSLGAVNSNFTNPHGLHDENHYTTAYDMALITKEAVRHEKFIELITTTSYSIPPTEKQPNERPLNNSNKMIHSGNTYYYEYAVGGKTGFTDEAGNTLVMYGEKDGIKLVSVVMHADNAASAYSDTRSLLEYGFTQFSEVTVFSSSSYSDIINITSESEGNTVDLGVLNVVAKEDVILSLPVSFNSSRVTLEKNIPYQIQPPIAKDTLIGTLSIQYDGSELANIDLYSADDFTAPAVQTPASGQSASGDEEPGLFSKILGFLGKLLLAMVIILVAIAVVSRILRYQRRKKKKARRRAQQARRNRTTQNYRYRDR